MTFDLRLPVGLLFTLLGLLLTGFGLVSPAEIYRRSLGINVNLAVGRRRPPVRSGDARLGPPGPSARGWADA